MTQYSFTIWVSVVMGSTRPFVEAACICENVIIDREGVASIIRIVDKFAAEIPEGFPAGIPPGFPVTVYVRLKSGGAARSGQVSVRAKRPDGTQGGRIDAKMDFTAPQHGVHFSSQFHIIKPQSGIYWFEVFWNEEHLTSFSADVTVKSVPIQQQGGSNPSLPANAQPTG